MVFARAFAEPIDPPLGERAGTRAYMTALRHSYSSLYEVSGIAPGVFGLQRIAAFLQLLERLCSPQRSSQASA
ncbi:hypothetical protein [Roseomonas sp. USHLN139]|uniref:hypothetical protein n=1 Tax=Roseomonas sp. USHLN139 TaxID=3081298 RepID=UPI003B02A862